MSWYFLFWVADFLFFFFPQMNFMARTLTAKWSSYLNTSGVGARVAPGSRWPSDLHCDGSLPLPSTLMAVELSGDTGAPTQSHVRVQSAQSSTCCHNGHDRRIKMFFLFIYIYYYDYYFYFILPLFISLSLCLSRSLFLFVLSVSPSHLCSPWLALVAHKVIVISQKFITWWHKAISIACAVPILFPCRELTPYVPDNTPWDRQGGVFLFHTLSVPLSRGVSHDHQGSLCLVLIDFYWLFHCHFT